ncbi:MAG: hypothetical protein GF411_07310 [Candidatus Lokiarchaeota archaeon]|nr:hypothetical protein [Candidatus Lokiarchaeota archaeon]
MSLLHRRLFTIVLLTLFVSSSVMTMVPLSSTQKMNTVTHNTGQQEVATITPQNLSIPYVDEHYGHADGIIDPMEYSFQYTDPVTGISVYLEHDSDNLYVGLLAPTENWVAFGWKNYNESFESGGLNGSDLIYGYAPGNPHTSIPRVVPTDIVTVHYELRVRNGTLLQEGDVPGIDSDTPLQNESLLQGYKDMIVGMRIGEVRHFILPAEEAYNRPGHPLYGNDLEYVITLSRIGSNVDNPADAGDIYYRDAYGTGTFQYAFDSNQSRILEAGGSDNASYTQLEYFIKMNSTDSNDIPLLNGTDFSYPFVLMSGPSEDLSDLPDIHSDWSSGIRMQFVSNTAPMIDPQEISNDDVLGFVKTIKLNVTDNSYVRQAFFRVDDENWTSMTYNFKSDFFEYEVDLSTYDLGEHTMSFKAVDPSNTSSYLSYNVTFDWPFIPLLGMKLSVVRTLVADAHQLMRTEDVFTILNNGSAPINAIEILLPKKWESKLLSVMAIDGSGRELVVTRLDDVNNMFHWRVAFFEPIGFEESKSFTFKTYLHSIHELVNFDERIYDLRYLGIPVVPYILTEAKFDIQLHDSDELQDASPKFTMRAVEPMYIREVEFSFYSIIPLLKADRKTTVSVGAWGWMHYAEEITIVNIGSSKENSLNFQVPAYADGIKIYDQVGILRASQWSFSETYEFNRSTSININLNSDRFGSNGLMPGYRYTFYLDYAVQTMNYEDIIPTGSQLEIPMGTLGNVLVHKHVVDVKLPIGINILQATDGYRLLFGVFDFTLRYSTYNTTRYNPATIWVLQQSGVSILARPILFALIFGMVAAIYVAGRRYQLANRDLSDLDEEEASTVGYTGPPTSLIRDYANLFSRKTALDMDLEKLESSRRRGKVTKKEYLLREKDIKSQLRDIASELPELRDKLVSYGGRYREMVSTLELEEEKIQGAKAGLRQLLIRRKKQRVSRVAFERSRQDYLKTISKSTTTIDRILLNLQEEAGED